MTNKEVLEEMKKCKSFFYINNKDKNKKQIEAFDIVIENFEQLISLEAKIREMTRFE